MERGSVLMDVRPRLTFRVTLFYLWIDRGKGVLQYAPTKKIPLSRLMGLS